MGFHTKASGYIGPANPGYCDAASMLSKGWNKVRDASVRTVYFGGILGIVNIRNAME